MGVPDWYPLTREPEISKNCRVYVWVCKNKKTSLSQRITSFVEFRNSAAEFRGKKLVFCG